MKQKRRFVIRAWATVLVCATVVFTGCGNPGGEDSNAGAPADGLKVGDVAPDFSIELLSDVAGLYPTEGIPLSVVIDAEGVVTYLMNGAGNNMFPRYQREVKIALGEAENDTLPLSEEEDQALYEAFMEASHELTYRFYDIEDSRPAIGEKGREIDGRIYYPVENDDVKTTADLKAHMRTMFRDAFVDELFSGDLYRDIDGALFIRPEARLKPIYVADRDSEYLKKSDDRYIVRISYVEESAPGTAFITEDFVCERIDGHLIFDRLPVLYQHL